MKFIKYFVGVLIFINLISCQKDDSILPNASIEKKVSLKSYLKTSYELSNFDNWYSVDDLVYTKENPFDVIQTTQLDINKDGIEDVITYESYPLNVSPTPNPPPNIFLSNGSVLNKVNWNGGVIKNPHGTKLLVGDYDNDSYPDVFSVVHVDQPFGAFPSLKDNCHLIFNSNNGVKRVLEFDDEGFWVTGCSGDIDKDGDLDIIMFNFHYSVNKVKNKIQWNDGKGNFTATSDGIGDIPIVQASELVDINRDGWLDLVIDYVQFKNGIRTPTIAIMWGNGKSFNLDNSIGWEYSGEKFMQNLDFSDLDGDGYSEIFVSGNIGYANSYIEVYKTNDGKSWKEETSQYFLNNKFGKFAQMIFKDIDKNGKMDIFSMNKKDNIRWEYDGSKFIKK
jgi:hypothetical protein